jgi:tetratricopeptide (TPR) repeat protein
MQSISYCLERQDVGVNTSIKVISLLDSMAKTMESDENLLNKIHSLLEIIDSFTDCTEVKESLAWEVMSKTIEANRKIFNLINRSRVQMRHNTLQINNDGTLSEKDPHPLVGNLSLAEFAGESGNYEEAILFFRQSLSIASTEDMYINTTKTLCSLYFAQKNWVTAIECCQDITNVPQLPPNSPAIIEANIDCEFACSELKDYSEALLSYTKALELQQQHYPHRHRRTADIHGKMGALFLSLRDATTAMEHLQVVVELDFPESASHARNMMATAYRSMQCDEVQSYLLRPLDIRQYHLSSDTDELVQALHLLADMEYATEDHQ